MGSKKHVADYLLDLSRSRESARKHAEDPDGHMDAAGLSEEDKDVIKSRDVAKIRAHLDEDDPPGCIFVLSLI